MVILMKEETTKINESRKISEEEKRKNSDEFNMMWKNSLVDHITPLLDDLRDSNKKEVNNICRSFVFMENDDCECTANTIKLALDEICDSNPDICGRVDVFDLEDTIDEEYKIPAGAKGLVWILFLEKDKDRYDHPDIDRLYIEHPQCYTGYFDDTPVYDPPKIDKNDFKSYANYFKCFLDADYNEEHFSLNQDVRFLFKELVDVKESNIPFMHLLRRESKVLDDPLMKEIILDNSFITDAIIDRAKQEGLKCETIKIVFDDTDYNEHIFIYKSESEEMNKVIKDLEKTALTGTIGKIRKILYNKLG